MKKINKKKLNKKSSSKMNNVKAFASCDCGFWGKGAYGTAIDSQPWPW
ncbi:MAG: hypothetical protein IKX10_10950 [Lachnospiraceae bacterium]|nr:hypothetical protein [Lachnospiraceae bacterium]